MPRGPEMLINTDSRCAPSVHGRAVVSIIIRPVIRRGRRGSRED